MFCIVAYIIYDKTKMKENFNVDAGKGLTNWKFLVNGPERRRFASKVKLTEPLEYKTLPHITINEFNFVEFVKQLNVMGTIYITCRENDKVRVMQDIVDRLHEWSLRNIIVGKENIYYMISILFTLSKLQSDPDLPAVIFKLDDIYAWIKSNLQGHLEDGTHSACAYLIMGTMSGNVTMVNEALLVWKRIFTTVIPNLMMDLLDKNKFMDVAYVINDTTLVMYIFFVNNMKILDDHDLQMYHTVVNKYAEKTFENHEYLTSLYGDKNPAHTLSWIVLYNRMFEWKNVEEKNLKFFTDNLGTMLTFRDVGYGGSTFWNFAI